MWDILIGTGAGPYFKADNVFITPLRLVAFSLAGVGEITTAKRQEEKDGKQNLEYI